MGKLANSKLKASIIESMIALIIVSFSLTAAFTIVLKVNQQQNSKQHTRARILADQIFYKSFSPDKMISEEIETEGLKIEKRIEWYNQEQHLLTIEVKVFDNKGKLLAFRRKTIISDEEYSTNP